MTTPINFRVTHTTEYQYQELASLSHNEARLVPRNFELPLFEQKCLRYHLNTDPIWSDHRERVDYFGNHVFYFTMRQPHDHMKISVQSDVLVTPGRYPKGWMLEYARQSPAWEVVRDRVQRELSAESFDARQYVLASPMAAPFSDAEKYALQSFEANRPILLAAHELMERIYTDFSYLPGTTSIVTPLQEVFDDKKGVCQDFAHFMLACLRSLRLPCRYVSGYIETVPPEGKEKLVGSDASHAWISLFLPHLGWIDFDPTNRQLPYTQHITIGWGRDYSDVTPLKGVFFGGGEHELKVSVDVRKFVETAEASARRSPNFG